MAPQPELRRTPGVGGRGRSITPQKEDQIKELTELSHHSLIQYRLPTTGEPIPLLQITPPRPTPRDCW